MTADFDPAPHRARIEGSPYHVWSGITVEEVDRGRVLVALDIQPHHLNPQGTVHGGVIAGLLDSACGMSLRTLLAQGANHQTFQLAVTYLRPGRAGRLVAEGNAVHSGRRTGYSEASVRDEKGALLARASATFVKS